MMRVEKVSKYDVFIFIAETKRRIHSETDNMVHM